MGLSLNINSNIVSRTLRPPNFRGNTVGVLEVTPDSYDTNESVTTMTVGASGATYTSLITAYANANPGDVIEIIDDSVTLEARLTLTKVVDGGGNAIKIKGKSIKSTLVLSNDVSPILTSGTEVATEFENIIFDQNYSNTPYKNNATNAFVHFINCEFDGGISFLLVNNKELVFDECSFINQIDDRVITNTWTSLLSSEAKIIINNCTCNYLSINNFIKNTQSATTIKFNYISVKNSNIIIASTLTTDLREDTNELEVMGNTLTNASSAMVYVGAEATNLVFPDYTAWSSLTSYVVGDIAYVVGNLWQTVNNNLDSEPSKLNVDWKPVEFITGKIENNTINCTTFGSAGHGLFIGFGAYDFSIKNNIVNNYLFNIVVKGSNNTIQYNCTGNGFKGISVFANDQAIISNNTSRSEDDSALQISHQALGGVGVDNTTIRDNILTTVQNGDDVFTVINSNNNTYRQNIIYGDNPVIDYEGSTYIASNETQFNNYKIASGDSKGRFLDPIFSGADPLAEEYYLPTNLKFLKLRDFLNQSVGAVDIIKYQ